MLVGTLSRGGEVSSGESHVVPSCPHSPLSPNTALSPEEAESALEAAHYFTEDSSSEGEHSLPLASGSVPSRVAEGRAGGLQPSPGMGCFLSTGRQDPGIWGQVGRLSSLGAPLGALWAIQCVDPEHSVTCGQLAVSL